MSVKVRSIRNLFLAALIPASMMLSGCGDDSISPEGPDPVLTVWLGTYEETGGGDSGAILIDITRRGSRVEAETVFRSREDDFPFEHLYLEGSAYGDSIVLSVDTAGMAHPFRFDILLETGSGGAMSGSFYHEVYDLAAGIDLEEIDQGVAAADTFVELDAVMLGMAFDGDHTWVSTAGWDHFLIDSAATVVETVAVFIMPGTHWSNDALTSDGNLLWGGFPVTVSDPGGDRDESDIVEFDKDGGVIRRFRVGHRTSGLAWDEGGLWSLPTASDALHRVNMEGTVLETVPVGVPDLVDIAFDGTDFWAVGWFMKRLYRITGSGDVLTVYHLPEEGGLVYPSALSLDGSRLWYGYNTLSFDSRIYILDTGVEQVHGSNIE